MSGPEICLKSPIGLWLLLATVFFVFGTTEVSETWFEYKARTNKERKISLKPSKELDQDVGKVLSRSKRTVGFPTGSTFTFTPVLCIPVVSLGDLSGSLDLELPFTITLPNATQITYPSIGRSNSDKVGVYAVITDALNRFGFDGRSCLLRAICEISEAPLKHDGLMGEIINIILGLSSIDRSDPVMSDYADAEYNGKAYGHCWSLYPECPISIFKLVEG